MGKLWRYEDFVDVEVWGQVEEEVAAVEDDEVDHTGPVKIGWVLSVVSHKLSLHTFDKDFKCEHIVSNFIVKG